MAQAMQEQQSPILLVEDDALLAYPVEELLLDHGYRSLVVHNGSEALKLIQQQRGNFRAVVTDIRLGPGPDGWEVARRARQVNSAVPIIYMTADSAAAWQGKGVPNSTILRKPFLLDHLVESLRSGADRQQA